MHATVLVEIPHGELIDKITILQIKVNRISASEKLRNVQAELLCLEQARDSAIQASLALDTLTEKLKAANESLWEIEDAIRDCEQAKDFGQRFVELARAVYHVNDRRAALKRQINEAARIKTD